jgi:hypothetical protein
MLTAAAFGMPEIKGHGWMIGVGRWKWVDVWAWPLALEFHEVFKQRIVGLGIGPGQIMLNRVGKGLGQASEASAHSTPYAYRSSFQANLIRWDTSTA